jgi:DNA-binding transcriptional ArsR family regulator
MSNHSAAAVFDALGDQTRRQIVEALRGGPRPVGELSTLLPVGRPAVSKHLRVLEGAGLVEHHSVGTRNLYALAPQGFAALQQWLVSTWDVALASYAARVAQRVGSTEEEQHGPASTGTTPGRRRRRA